MKRDFTAIYKKSGKWIVAWVEEIPGVNTQGKTLKEAITLILRSYCQGLTLTVGWRE